MDRTLKTAKRKNKRRQNRNGSAWRRFSPDGTTCRYCNPEPCRFGPSTDTTDDTEKGETT